MTNIILPTPDEVVRYVTTDTNFLAKLYEAAKITRETGKEASLELQLDLVEGKRHLSDVGIGTEKEPGPIKNTHNYTRDQYVKVIHLHSHPSSYSKWGFVSPSGDDLLSTLATLSRNTEKLVKHRKIKAGILTLQENVRIAHHVLKWTHHEAVIGVKDNLNVGMVLFENNSSIFRDGPDEEFHPKNQEEVMGVMRTLGFNTQFFQYILIEPRRYEVHKLYCV